MKGLKEIIVKNYSEDQTPIIQIFDDGTSYLLIDDWPLKDERFSEEEIDNFEEHLTNLLGVEVEQEDRDCFVIYSNDELLIDKLRCYLENK